MATVTNVETHRTPHTERPGPRPTPRPRTLSELLRAGRPAVESACEIAVQLCDELMRHQDHITKTVGINPDNVHLEALASGALRASLPSNPPQVGTFHDTPGGVQWLSDSPRRIPPEVLDGQSPDARSAVYVIGVVLYELLSGAPLTESHGSLDAGNRHSHPDGSVSFGEWKPLIHLNPLIPEPLVRAVESALERDPAERIRSPAELMRQLLPYVADDSEIRADAEQRLSRSSLHDDDSGEWMCSPSLRLQQAPKPRKVGQPPSGQLIWPVFPKSPAPPSQLRIPDAWPTRTMSECDAGSTPSQSPSDRHALPPGDPNAECGNAETVGKHRVVANLRPAERKSSASPQLPSHEHGIPPPYSRTNASRPERVATSILLAAVAIGSSLIAAWTALW